MKKFCIILCSVLFLIFSCSPRTEKKVVQFQSMNTWMSIQGWGNENCKEALEKAKLAIENLDKSISTTDSESKIYDLNSKSLNADKNSVTSDFSSQVFQLAQYSLKMAEVTKGAFNPCLYPVTKAWGFTTEKYTVPEKDIIDSLLKNTDYKQVQIQESQLNFPGGMMLDFGGIGKGYAGDIAIQVMKEEGVKAGLLDLGGNVQVFGTKPEGDPWKIGIRNPVGEGVIAGLEIQTGAVITSGGYERFFIADDGNKYIHIIDSENGMPVNNGLVSVTIVADSGAYADALSTALFVMGKEKAIEFWKENGSDFEFIIMNQTEDESLEIFYTENLKNKFYLIENVADTNVKKIQIVSK